MSQYMLVGNEDPEKSVKESNWVGYLSSHPTFEEVQSCCILDLLGFAKMATVIENILVVHLPIQQQAIDLVQRF